MSLRTRLMLAGGGAVFVALAIASLVIYVDVRSKLHDQIDFSLIQSAEDVAAKWHSNVPIAFGKDANGIFQVVSNVGAARNEGLSAAGTPVQSIGATATPPSHDLLDHDQAVASGLARPYFRDVRFAGTSHRLYTTRLPSQSG